MKSLIKNLMVSLCCAISFMSAAPTYAALVENPQSFVDSKVEAYRKGLEVLEETYREKCTAGGMPLKKVVVGNPPEAGGGGGAGGGGAGGGGQGAGGQGDGGQGVGLGRPGGEYVIRDMEEGLPLVEFEVEQVTDSWSTANSGKSDNPFTVEGVPQVFDVPGVDPRQLPGPLPPPRPPINGLCGSSNGGTFDSAPTGDLCSYGTASAVSGNGPWNWICFGINGGKTSYCTANKKETKVDGKCGSSNGGTFDSAPTGDLCSAGTASLVNDEYNHYYWTCMGKNGGTNAHCSANKTPTPAKVDGKCGTSNGGTFDSAPTGNLCSAGTQSAVSGTGPWNWTCTGTNGGTSASCSANKTPTPAKVDGKCGTSNGGTFDSAPTGNLCSAGTQSAVSGTGPWNWTCTGINGGTNSSCSANKTPTPAKVDGKCGSSNGGTFDSAPTGDLCSAGTQSAVSGTGPWNWTCTGTNGGTNASCSANKTPTPVKVDGKCGSSNGGTFDSAPTGNLCSAGTQSAVSGNGPWNWTCTGTNGGTNASCSANKTATPQDFKLVYAPTSIGSTEYMLFDFSDTVQSGSASTITANILSDGASWPNMVNCSVNSTNDKQVRCSNAAPWMGGSSNWESGHTYIFDFSAVKSAAGAAVQASTSAQVTVR